MVRTKWSEAEIWIRQEFQLESTDLVNSHLRIHHDEDAEVYINGKQAARLNGYQTGYVNVPFDANAADLLRVGANTIAVHCRNTGGGQFVDVGIVDLYEVDEE